MKKVVIFDTAIGTTNLGDEIILQCLEEQLAFLLDNCFLMRFSTHTKNMPLSRYFLETPKIQFSYEADFKLIMGTNLLGLILSGNYGDGSGFFLKAAGAYLLREFCML